MTIGTIRRASVADLPQVYDIFYEAETEGDAHPPPPGAIPSLFQHELETGEMYVVERGNLIIAFASLITRGSIAYLSQLFVRKDYRCAKTGQTLLQHILPRDGRTCCTLSSRDPRALALYVRVGMRPQWPNFLLRVNSADLGDLPSNHVEIIEGQRGDPAFVRWDAEISGRSRPLDHAYWMRETKGVPLWFEQEGRIVGYGYIQMRSDDSLWHPDAITLGPIGARAADHALACVCAAARWAQPRAAVLRIAVPGPHPSLGPLLDAHFRITYVETFMLSAAEPFVNAECYIPSGSALF